MKKTIFLIILGLIVIIVLNVLNYVKTADKPYEFQQDISEIERIEIVFAQNQFDFTVEKTLSETEKEVFLEHFQNILFSRYILGDPTSVYGKSVRIVYQDQSYDIICSRWVSCVKKNNYSHSPWLYCVDDKEFESLMDRFIEG